MVEQTNQLTVAEIVAKLLGRLWNSDGMATGFNDAMLEGFLRYHKIILDDESLNISRAENAYIFVSRFCENFSHLSSIYGVFGSWLFAWEDDGNDLPTLKSETTLGDDATTGTSIVAYQFNDGSTLLVSASRIHYAE